MTVGTLFPAYGAVRYHSPYGVHTSLVPTRAWNPAPLVPGNTLGGYTNWSGIPCDGEEMWDDFVDTWVPFFHATVILDTITIYTIAVEGAPAIPRAVKAYGTAGTEADVGWDKAVQRTWILRDTEFNIAKYVMLDAPSFNNFQRISDISGSPESLAFFGAVSSLSWAFASRKGFRPSVFQSLTTDLNDKLRKEYGLG